MVSEMPSPIAQKYNIAYEQSPSPMLSIIIVSWNTRDLVAQCLRSIQGEIAANFSAAEVETFVVDNSSKDGTVEYVRLHFPWVQTIENRENVGFASANNQALALSTGRYVLLLNPDTEIGLNALAELVRFMDANPAAGAVGSRLLNPDRTLQSSCHPQPTLRREVWRLFHLDKIAPFALYRMDDWPIDKSRAVDVVQGAALLIRREVIEKVGVLDTDYYIYSEEVDLCYRIRRSGWHIYWVPTSVVIHYGGQSTQQIAAAMFLQLYRSKVIYFRKNHGALTAQIYKVILLTAGIGRLAASPLARLLRPRQRQHTSQLVTNYRRLLLALPRL
jgi:GT2 family glycosyltransferase